MHPEFLLYCCCVRNGLERFVQLNMLEERPQGEGGEGRGGAKLLGMAACFPRSLPRPITHARAGVLQMVSRELEQECIVVFDEAHNIDNVCIEALSVNLRQQTLDAALRNVRRLEGVRSLFRAGLEGVVWGQ